MRPGSRKRTLVRTWLDTRPMPQARRRRKRVERLNGSRSVRGAAGEVEGEGGIMRPLGSSVPVCITPARHRKVEADSAASPLVLVCPIWWTKHLPRPRRGGACQWMTARGRRSAGSGPWGRRRPLAGLWIHRQAATDRHHPPQRVVGVLLHRRALEVAVGAGKVIDRTGPPPERVVCELGKERGRVADRVKTIRLDQTTEPVVLQRQIAGKAGGRAHRFRREKPRPFTACRSIAPSTPSRPYRSQYAVPPHRI